MRKRLWFRNSRGLYLVGELLSPNGDAPCGTVILAHELNGERNNIQNMAVAEQLLDRGIASLLFDFTGHGESQGQLQDATIDQLVEDLGAALDRLLVEKRVDPARIGATGHGEGGTAALLRAATDKRIKALVLHNAAAGALEVLEAASCVDAPTLLIVGDGDPSIVHENHALQISLASETSMEMVKGADIVIQDPGALRKLVELSTNWFSQKLNVLATA